ncbi:MAG: DUF4199 domain-containing protein, partial [Opitutaceae bacterium]
MKTCALYGFIWALGGAFLTLILFFMGFHSDPAKLQAAGWIGGLAGIAIAVICMVLGVKARRAEVPAEAEFGYGSAFGAGFLIALVQSVLTSVFWYVYRVYINPGFGDIVIQDQLSKMEAKGLTGDRLDKAESVVRMMNGPVLQIIFALIGGIILGTVLALIIAAFVKRAAPAGPPKI